MKKINLMLRKCKSLSRQLGRSSSYSSLRSKSTKEHQSHHYMKIAIQEQERQETLFVGSTRKRYVISSKYLTHPLLNALIEKTPSSDHDRDDHNNNKMILVKCEVVLFDHLMWMLENADPNLTYDSVEELAELYVF